MPRVNALQQAQPDHFENQDIEAMQVALEQAAHAETLGEVPVGACITDGHGQIIARGANAPRSQHDPTAHAEIQAIRQACQALNNYRLVGCTLYVTLEPCLMCAGALLHARIKRVVFGAFDEKSGRLVDALGLHGHAALNHTTLWQGGCLQALCQKQLKAFFSSKR